MAIYKPNNFYPHLQEIDLTNENTFSCQVNTDGAMVSAARLTISSEDNILVYENLYQFVDEDGEKDPIENKGFMELPMDPYKIDKSNISFDLIDKTLTPIFYKYGINEQGNVIYYDQYGEKGEKIGFATREEAMAAQVYDEDKTTILYNTVVEDGMLDNYNKKVVIINNIDFITLHPDISYDVRKDYCPYNFYNVKLKDSFCFGLKFVNSSDENDVFLYPFKNLDYEKTDAGYNMKIIYNTELLLDDISNYDCYIVLLNDKDYTWDVKMYEHLFSDPSLYVDKGTLVTDGYIAGSTKSVLWWDNNKQSTNTLFNKKEIKEDYYVEITADQNNSDLFEEQIKMGRMNEGILTKYNINNDRTKFIFSDNLIDVELYKMENLFLRVQFANKTPSDKKIKSDNYFKIKEILKEENFTSLILEDLIIQNLIFDFLDDVSVYYRKALEKDGIYTYYDEYGIQSKKQSFNTLEEAELITEITSRYIDDDQNPIILTNVETEINSNVKYSIVYKQREKITWITENLGFDKNINKIEVENDFDVTLKNDSIVDIYGGNNNNTNYSFFGVRDSDISVNDIYVRFPGYQGADFNGNAINDSLEYYENVDKTGKQTKKIYEKGAKDPLELVSKVGLQGSFYNSGSYYNSSTATTPIDWSQEDYQPVSLYGKNVSYKVFENNSESKTYGYMDIFNPKNMGTASCNYGFSIEIESCRGIIINGDVSYNSGIPNSKANIVYSAQRHGSLFFYLDSEGEWSMYAINPNWWASGSKGYTPSGSVWDFPDYPKVYKDSDGFCTPEIEDQIAKRYKIGKIDSIEIDFGGSSYAAYDPRVIFYYYDSLDFVENSVHTGYNSIQEYGNTSRYQYFYPRLVTIPESYCKLFKVTSYDYETGEFVIAGGLERSILNTDKYEIWQRTVGENMTNEYNITEIAYTYTRLYPPHDKYDEIAYVGDTKILREGIKIMNNTEEQIFIQPNINFYSDEYNYSYLILDNYNQRIEFPYKNKIYDDGFTIQDRTINTLDGSQWLLNYNNSLGTIPKSGQTYKLYMDTCKSTPSNWFYGRNIANITMRVGEYNYIRNQLDKGYVKPIEFSDYKTTFNDITNKKIGNNCLVQCVDAYFMATYDQLSVPIKRYRYEFYDSSMNLIKDSEYIYDNYISYGVRGLRNEEIYLLHFEMEDQLGYVYTYEEKIIVKYIEYNTNLIQLQLTNKESQGCIMGDFVTMVEAVPQADENGTILDYIISERDTYDEYGNSIKKGEHIKKGTVYAKLCQQEDFINKLNCSFSDDIFVYRRNKEKLLSFVCKINLSKDQIITGREDHEHRYGFIDYGVYNNEYYDYVVILKQQDLTTDSHLGNMEYTYSESRCKTSFNGWILVDIEKDEDSDSYYVSEQVWNFKYNLESQDLTQNTSVSKWDTLGKYANVYIGQKNYISSGLTCLLGDVGTYYTYNGDKFKENFGYFEQSFENVNYDDIYNIISNEVLTNNIDKYLDWRTFNSNGNPKLLKDYKGNVWIVQIMENPTVKNADNSKEQIYTISFNWVEIMDWRKYPILGRNISFDREESANIEMMDILEAWDYNYESGDIYYNLSKIRDDYALNNVLFYESPFLVSGRITLENNAMTGILNDSYLGSILLESGKQFLSSMTDSEVENIYNSQSIFMSPFKTKQLDNSYAYSSGLEYLDFEQSLLYENNSIDFLCCRMNMLKGININLTDAIKTARYAFAGTSITTDVQYQIQINTNNYINTYGMLDDLQGNGVVTVKWGTLADEPDLVTYAELYERYWNNDKIVLDCKFNFNIDDWTLERTIDEIGNIDGVDYTKKIVLNSYEGNLTSVYIPKFYKDENGEIYLIELSENFNI